MAKQKTIGKLKQDVQKVFNAYIRKRDEGKPCISCGEYNGAHAGHFFSAGHYQGLRFCEDNCHLQCVKCNNFLHGNLIHYRDNLLERIGQERFDALYERAALYKKNGYKFTRSELIEIKQKYQQKLKEL